MTHHLRRYERHLLRERFPCFLRHAFRTVDPTSRFLPNWHLEALSEYLEATRRGEVTRLLINMPPRMLKSVSVSVAWPAFLLGHRPSTRIMAASYSSYLALRHAQDCRLVIGSEWYRKTFPRLCLAKGRDEKTKFVTTEQGFRFATSVGGSATGEGGDTLIVDDPLNPLQAHSKRRRDHASRWFDQTFSTRLNDKHRGVIIVVMQRLHEEDLSGHLLTRGGWDHLLLPAIAEKRTLHRIGGYRHLRREGELLHPDRESPALLDRARRELGTQGFAAQYQQRPLATDGGMFKAAWLRRHAVVPGSDAIVQSWDTAIKTEGHHDRSVCLTFALDGGVHHLIDVYAGRADYPELRRKVVELAAQHAPQAILIEDKASGQSLIQDLRASGLPILPRLPRGDKELRAATASPTIEAGRLSLPVRADWLDAFESEYLRFPHDRHDDQIDALTQYLLWHRERDRAAASLRRL